MSALATVARNVTGVVRSHPAVRRAGRQAVARTAPLRVAGPVPLLAVRSELTLLLNRRGLTGDGVEVGVKAGEFSEILLDHWRGRRLISVDPWLEQPTEIYADTDNVEQGEHDALHQVTIDRLARFGARSEVWRMTGTEAAARIPAGSLDFVYLDARHDYASVRSDVAEWFPKVKAGGLLAGHDYVDGEFDQGSFGVKRAVDEFFDHRAERVRTTLADPPWVSWFVVVR